MKSKMLISLQQTVERVSTRLLKCWVSVMYDKHLNTYLGNGSFRNFLLSFSFMFEKVLYDVDDSGLESNPVRVSN